MFAEGLSTALLQVSTGAPPLSLSPDQAGRSALLILIVFLIGFFCILALIMVAILRRRALETQRRVERLERDTRRPPPVDAWAEAGRRASVPAADDLNDTKVPLTGPDTRAQPSPGRPTVLITGAARRVGRAIALELAAVGCDVQFTYHASNEDAQRLARELADLGAECSFFQLDLGDLDAVEAFARERAEMLGHLDVLVHNASTYDPSPLNDLTPQSAQRQYAVNALAPLILTSRFAPLLRDSRLAGGGAVVALADIHALGRPRRDFAAYSMSKAALVEMVRCLARDLAPQVRVNAVAPGVVAWPEEGHESDPESQAKYLRRIPLGRAGTPEDAARVVRWLAFEATYTTGEVIRVDGGRWLT